ncbi:membrane protein insertase YidC 2 [Lachnospiraceae bacterium]|nr:membrane protein insertase YidC 2 [Lachnospiraceae bacterium]
MTGIVLTQYDGMILGPIAKVLGYLMEGIFTLLDLIGIPNVGLSIILFTIVIYLLLMPLTIKQQKFSKLSAKMNPELQAIQAKYKNKKDNESMMAMNAENQAVYAKYGVSPSGSCIQLLIQMPILFALYRVIYAMPAYVGRIKEAFFPLVTNLISQTGSLEFLQTFKNTGMYTRQISNEAFVEGMAGNTYVQNTYIDILNKASSSEFASIADKFPNLAQDVQHTLSFLDEYNNFLGINIGNSPSYMVGEAWGGPNGINWLMIIAAFVIPVLSALTQWINTKLMPQPDASNKGDQQNSMAQSMKMMNTMMPLMSAFFCYTLPAGMGLYWIAGSVVRSIQQVIINKHIDKMDIDELIKNNEEKRNKKLEKAGIDPRTLNRNATLSTKNVNPAGNSISSKASVKPLTQAEKEEAMRKSTEYYSKNAKPGSLASKANMVRQYNEKNNK